MSTIVPSNTKRWANTKRWVVSPERFWDTSQSTSWRWALRLCWVISFVMPVVFLAWLLYDGYASRALSGTWMDLLEVPQRETQQEPLSQSLIGPRLYWVQFIAITASLTSSLSVLGFLFGPRPFSGLKSLFGFVLLSGCWLLMLTQWDRIHYLGRSAFVTATSSSVTEFADRVNQNWNALVTNTNNECQIELSSFNAYPLYNPTMMMFLGDQSIPNSPLLFRAIERDEERAIRFELSGENLGYWIERRYDRKEPTDFIGGLAEAYRVGKYRKIADQLYLVDYR